MNPAPALDDARLLPLLREGNEAAWREFVDALKTKLVAVIKRTLAGDAHEAEEVAMQAFQRAHRGIATFRADCKLESWIFAIAINLARNRYWFHVRRRRGDHLALDYVPAASSVSLHDAIADSSPGPAEIHELDDVNARLRLALPLIPDLQREAIVLCMAGRSYREIAELLDVNMGTVKSRIARARHCLRAEMRLAS